MSGGKGGSQTSQVEIPAYLENASKKSLNRAEDTQNIGYMPYMGPDVAAFTQPQQQAMQANIDAAAAFGLVDPGLDAMAGMPQAQDFNGVQGYSSFPMYQMAVDDLKASRPGQVAAYDDLYVDPITGTGGHNNGFPYFPGLGRFTDPGRGSISRTPVDYDPGAGRRSNPVMPSTHGGQLIDNSMPAGPFIVNDPVMLPREPVIDFDKLPATPPMSSPIMQPPVSSVSASTRVDMPMPAPAVDVRPDLRREIDLPVVDAQPLYTRTAAPSLNQGLDMSGFTGSVPTYNTKMSARPQVRNSKKR